MAGLGNLAGGSAAAIGVKVVLDADPIGIVKGFAQADTAGKKFAATLSGLENIGKSAFRTLQGALNEFEKAARRVRNAGIGLGIGLTGAVVGASQLDAAMHNVATIDPTVRHNFEQSIDMAIQMSHVLPASAKEITEAWYEIASSGFQGAEGAMVLNQAVKAGVSGLASTSEAGQALTAVLNAYGLSANHAREVSDLMFQTVNLGVLHFSDLTGVVGDSVGLAAAAGVGFKEVGSAIASMTLNGISASEAGTSLNRMIQSLIQPSESLQFAWSRLTIMPLAQALRDVEHGGMGLHGVMMLLQQASHGNVEVLKSWFDEIRAARGAFSLLANDGNTYTRIFGEMGQATAGQGATQKAFREQMQSTSMQFKLLMNDIKAIGLQIGDALQPIADAAIRTARLFLGAWDQIPKPLKELLSYFLAFASVAQIVIGILGVLAAKWVLQVGVMALVSAGLQRMGTYLSLQGEQWAILGTRATAFGEKMRGMTFSQFLISGITAPIKLAGQAFEFLGGKITGTRPALTGFGVALQRTGGIMQSVASNAVALAGVFSLVALAALAVAGDMTRSQREANAWVQSWSQTIDQDTVKGLSSGIDLAQRKLREARGEADRWDSSLHPIANSISDINDNLKTTETGARAIGSAVTNLLGFGHAFGDPFGDVDKENKAREKLQELQRRFLLLAHIAEDTRNIQMMKDPTYATAWAGADAQTRVKMTEGRINLVTKAIKTLGYNTKDLATLSQTQIGKIADQVTHMAAQAGMTDQELEKYGDNAVAAFNKQQKALNEFNKGVMDSFNKSFDIAGAVTEGGQAGRDELAKYLYIFNTQAQGFVDDMGTLMQKGLDPEILAQFAQAGPEASHNAIQAMLSDSSGQLIQFANETVMHLRDLRERLARESQIIGKAAMSPFLAGDVATAMKIGDVAQFLGRQASPERIAEALGISPADAQRIADEFDIHLALGLTKTTTDALAALGPLGPEIKSRLQKAAIDAQITDADASMIFEAFTTKGREAATTVIENMNLVPEKKQMLLDLLGYLETIAGLEHVQGEADTTGKKNPKVKVEAETTEAEAALSRVLTMITGIPPSRQFHLNVDAVISANTAAFLAAQAGIGIAKGGIFQGKVQTFAQGSGEIHQAQIANGYRIWAEPETGGEAYIPLHYGQSNRRSMSILGQVADMFGYALVQQRDMQTRKFANGGLIGGSASSGGVGRTVVVNTSIEFSGDIAGHDAFREIAHDVMDRRDRQVSIALSRKG